MKKAALLLALSVILSSCYTTRSAFTNEKLTLGMSKEQVISQFGPPYREDLPHQENGHTLETLYYKERVWSTTWFTVNTKLYFQDSKLINKEQTDEEERDQVLLKQKE